MFFVLYFFLADPKSGSVSLLSGSETLIIPLYRRAHDDEDRCDEQGGCARRLHQEEDDLPRLQDPANRRNTGRLPALQIKVGFRSKAEINVKVFFCRKYSFI